MAKRLLIILLILSNMHCIASSKYWKHHASQGNVASCHTFACVALIEASLYQKTGEHINLSERDLFIRHLTHQHRDANHFIESQIKASLKPDFLPRLAEMGHISQDFLLAKKYGIASEKHSPYAPTFRKGVGGTMRIFRFELEQLHQATLASEHTNNTNKASARLQRYGRKRLITPRFLKFFQPAPLSQYHQQVRNHLRSLQLKKITPSSTAAAKKLLIERLAHQPVAIDISNFSEFSGFDTSLHSLHSLVLSSYNPKSDTFTVRSSAHTKQKDLSAEALARGCYQVYYLTN